MVSNSEELKLFLCEKESQEDDGERWLDIYIKLSPEGLVIRKEITLPISEIKKLGDLPGSWPDSELTRKLYSKFGITDLSSHPGQPKGPCYWLDKEVFDAMLNLVKGPER